MVAFENFSLGRNALCYYNESGTLIGAGASTGDDDYFGMVQEWLNLPSTKIADNIMDLTMGISSDMADATTRGTAAVGGFSSSVPVLKNGEVSFDMKWIPNVQADTFTGLLINAWDTFGRIGLVFLDLPRDLPLVDQDAYNVTGLAANWSVSLEKQEAIRDIQKASVTLTISDAGLWYVEQMTASP